MKRLNLLILVTLPLACVERAAEPEPAPLSAHPPILREQVRGLRRLALEDPGGTTDVDLEIRQFQAQLERHPKKLAPWILLGRAWIRKARQLSEPGYYHNADACADVALDLEPDHPLALNLRGLVLMNDHRFDEARKLMTAVLARDPDDVMALGTLSDALVELGRHDEAVRHAQRMVDLKPSLPSYTRAAYLRWLTGDVRGALSVYRAAVLAAGSSEDPEAYAWVLVETAKVFWHQGDLDGAEAGLDRALAAFSNYPTALAWKARIALARGAPVKALSLAKRAYAGAALAETARIWHDAAQAAGDLMEAMMARAKLEQLGRHGEARVLASFYADQAIEPKGAVILAERELAGRGDVYTHDAYAWALYRAGRVQDALVAAERANRLGTPDATLRYHLGVILKAAGRTWEAERQLAAARRLNPHAIPGSQVEG